MLHGSSRRAQSTRASSVHTLLKAGTNAAKREKEPASQQAPRQAASGFACEFRCVWVGRRAAVRPSAGVLCGAVCLVAGRRGALRLAGRK